MKCEHADPRPLEEGKKWCRFCGALYVAPGDLMSKLGFSGWAYPANDRTQPTMLNMIREAKEGKGKEEGLVAQEGELPIPPPVVGEKGVREIVRVWERPNGLVVYHRVGAWDDPITWCFLLADIVRNVSRAYIDKGKLVYRDGDGNEEFMTYEHVEERIVMGFNTEMEDGTVIPKETKFDA